MIPFRYSRAQGAAASLPRLAPRVHPAEDAPCKNGRKLKQAKLETEAETQAASRGKADQGQVKVEAKFETQAEKADPEQVLADAKLETKAELAGDLTAVPYSALPLLHIAIC